MGPLPHSVLYPRDVVTRGHTEICFGENQISAGLISLLLLSTAHPLSLQPKWVRASTDFYIRFTLAMDSSPAFGSAPRYQCAHLTLAFAVASPLKGLTEQRSATRRLIIQKARRHTSHTSSPKGGCRLTPHPEDGEPRSRRARMVLRPLVSTRFQVLFHLRLKGLLFIFRSRYFCAIGRPVVLSLGRWASRIQAGFHVSDPTWEVAYGGSVSFVYRPFTFCGATFQNASTRENLCNSAAVSCSTTTATPATPVPQRAGLGTRPV